MAAKESNNKKVIAKGKGKKWVDRNTQNKIRNTAKKKMLMRSELLGGDKNSRAITKNTEIII